MRWTERQLAMLREMGIDGWYAKRPDPAQADAALVSETDGSPALANRSPSPQPRSPSPGLLDAATARHAAREAAPLRQIGGDTALKDAKLAIVQPSGHRPDGIEIMGWGELRSAVATCTACRLCQGRTQAVFGTGNLQAQWLIVGEAPGEQEDLQGEPFVGKSGQLLDSMLRAIGLTRGEAAPAQQVYIANTIKCRPPGNRNPQPDELAQCEPFLIRQLALLRPRIIVAMGRFAVQSLLRSDEPVGRLRGRVHHYQGVPLIVTYHPAYLLRNPLDKARAWDDLCLALGTARRTAPA